MFHPNSVGLLYVLEGRDVHTREIWSEPKTVRFSPIDLENSTQKTTVRADSSASRGKSESSVSPGGKALFPKNVAVEIGYRFEFEGMSFMISSKHVRRSVFGRVDHVECDLEILP